MREMKDSGQAWLCAIPAEWELSTIGSLYSLRNEKVSDRDYPPLSVTMKGIVPQLETAAKTDAHDDRKLVKKGDFAINSRSDRRGSCGISDYEGSVSLINTILTPRKEMDAVYYNWVFHTSQFADEFYRWGHGIVDDLWTTRWQEMKNISVMVPPLSQQKKIAAALKTKVDKINALIANQEAQIEKLKQYKQSLITEVVTKGLDPNAPMKDSGVIWIGSIPRHWRLGRIKEFFRIENGSDPKTDGQIPVYGSGAESYKTCGEYKVGPTVLLGRKGATLHIPHYIDGKYWNADTAFNTVPTGGYDLKLFFYVAHCLDYGFYKSQTTLPGMTQTAYSNMLIPVPPENEQNKIVSVLSLKLQVLDSLINRKQTKIQKINEYKKSLIYEYVTGKKEVSAING